MLACLQFVLQSQAKAPLWASVSLTSGRYNLSCLLCGVIGDSNKEQTVSGCGCPFWSHLPHFLWGKKRPRGTDPRLEDISQAGAGRSAGQKPSHTAPPPGLGPLTEERFQNRGQEEPEQRAQDLGSGEGSRPLGKEQ